MTARRFFTTTDYLWPAVLLSLVVHGVLLYLSWPWAIDPVQQAFEPEIALVNYKNDAEQVQSLLIAQWQAAGGGEGEPHEAASAPFTGNYVPSPNELVLLAMQQRLKQVESEQYQRLLQLEAQWELLQSQTAATQAGTDTQAQPLQLLQQHLAQELHLLKTKLNQYNARPKIHFDAPSTQASAFAAYIEQWRATIERLGTEHYPDAAKGQLSDSLQMTVYIDQAGHVVQVDIQQPAQNPLFNVAAQRIVRLGAPYTAFTDEMREQTDILAITRSWHFTQGTLRTD